MPYRDVKLKNPQWPVIKVLVRRLGLRQALVVGARIKKREGRGEPFNALAPPADRNEALSRAQIGPAILMFEELSEVISSERAFEIAEEAILASGVVFMRRQLGRFDRAALAALTPSGREAFTKRAAKGFFNATMRWERVDADGVDFTITSCHFPGLCRAVGVPEMAPIFCRVDEAYFGRIEPTVELTRLRTLAEGGKDCPFQLRWRADET